MRIQSRCELIKTDRLSPSVTTARAGVGRARRVRFEGDDSSETELIIEGVTVSRDSLIQAAFLRQRALEQQHDSRLEYRYEREHENTLTSESTESASLTTEIVEPISEDSSAGNMTRNSSRRSWIWQHGTAVTVQGKGYWQCKLCKRNPKRYVDGSTKHPIDHLRFHQLSEAGPIELEAGANILRQAFGNSTPKIQFNIDVFKQLLIQWIISSHISFRQVEEPDFRLLLSYLASVSASYTSIPSSLPRSGNTVPAWAMQLFGEQKQLMIRLLKQAHVVHFSFDLWTSGNHLSLLGFVAHWINSDAKSCRALLGLKRLHGAHFGENQSQVIMALLQEYQLTKKVGYFTLDNASNNDVALASLALKLKELGIIFNPVEHRLRCIGHVINLVVKAFLYGASSGEVQIDIDSDTSIDEDSTTQIAFWRKRGPYGRLRNVITYICWTPQRREEFSRLTHEATPDETAFQPITANLTRWNSDYKAIKRALQLRNRFEVFVARHIRDGLENDQLTIEDWKDLQDIVNVLEPFHRCSLELEGHRGNGALYDLLPTMDYLLDHLESTKSIYTPAAAGSGSRHLSYSIGLAWEKLNKYYTLTENNTALYAAVALHPSMKFDYFDINWVEHSDWIKDAKVKVKHLWEST